MTHAWCHDTARDAAVRAAEDNRTGPLPTLGEAIVAPFACTACGGYGMDHRCKESCEECAPTPQALDGMRTERVVLEITRPAIANYPAPAKQFMWQHLLRNVVQGDRESVRVVEEACPDAWAQTFARLEAERDAAIRERQKLEARVAELEAASGGNLPETPDGSSQAAKPELPTG